MAVIAMPSSGLCNSNADIASRLREMADDVEEGLYGNVDTVVSLVEADSQIQRATFGKPCDRARVVGLMTMAIHNASCGAVPE